MLSCSYPESDLPACGHFRQKKYVGRPFALVVSWAASYVAMPQPRSAILLPCARCASPATVVLDQGSGFYVTAVTARALSTEGAQQPLRESTADDAQRSLEIGPHRAIRVPFRVLFIRVPVLFWGPKKGP